MDRTNAAQFCIGKVVLGHQLFVLGHSASPLLESEDTLVSVLMNLYEVRVGQPLECVINTVTGGVDLH